MAVLTITEFADTPRYWTGAGVPVVDTTKKVTTQTLAIGGSTAQSNAFNGNTQFIRVDTDAICRIEVGGTNPTALAANTGAATGSARMAADLVEYFYVAGGDKLAVITST